MNRPLRLRKGLAADRNGTDLRNHDHPVAFDRCDIATIEVLIRHIPNVDGQRILRANHIVRSNRHILKRREPAGMCVKKIIAELL